MTDCDGCHWYNQEEDKCECDGDCNTCKQSQGAINVKVSE